MKGYNISISLYKNQGGAIRRFRVTTKLLPFVCTVIEMSLKYGHGCFCGNLSYDLSKSCHRKAESNGPTF